jgi:hypothetical protein
MSDEGLASLILKLGQRSFKSKMGHLDIKDANFIYMEVGILNQQSKFPQRFSRSGARSARSITMVIQIPLAGIFV